ncbi:MAG: methyltransferase [Bacteroidetes bacterium]|nr:methyltransferase [Bacteroidota bacterium]
MSVVFIVFTKLLIGDASEILSTLESDSIDLCMTSPPYWGLRDYGVAGQFGLEKSFDEYVEKLAGTCAQIMRVLKPSGSFYLNLGDTYAGSNGAIKKFPRHKTNQSDRVHPTHGNFVTSDFSRLRRKSLIGIPWRIALRLINDGWILRNDIIWYKPNAMPAAVKDRLSNSYEHLFHFVKTQRYYYDLDAIRVPNKAASIKRMALAAQQGLRPKKTKYTPGQSDEKLVQGGKYFVPNWVRELSEDDPALNKMQRLSEITNRAINHGMYAGGVFKGIHSHPIGRNPGDVVSYPSSEKRGDLGKNPSDFWAITTRSFRGAHFAVYPETLCVRPILSSCPETVCAKCGSPTHKVSQGVTAKPFNIRYRDAQSGRLQKKWGDSVTAPVEAAEAYDEQNYKPRSSTRVVWQGCSCNAGYEPATVLDPFAGSCTTLKAARDHGRNGIGIEINPDYIEVARMRLGAGGELQVINPGSPA